MVSEKLNLWYCDTFVSTPWQFYLLIVPLIGAFFYGRGKYKLAWSLIGVSARHPIDFFGAHQSRVHVLARIGRK